MTRLAALRLPVPCIAVVCCVLLGSPLLWYPSGSARADQIDGVAAIVDDQVVLESEVDLASALLLERARRTDQPITTELRDYVYKEALQSLIDTKLVLEFAERRDLVATPAEIDQAVKGIAQDEGVPEDTVYKSAEQQGLSREDYRNELRNQITRMKVIQNIVRGRVAVEDAEVQRLFDERYASQSPGMRVRVRHILLPWPTERTEESDEQLRELAARIRQKAVETGAFANLARQFSRAPTAEDGGLTVFREGDVAPQIAAEIFGLPAGEISPVIETEHGLNLFQVLDRFDPSKVEFDDVEGDLRLELMERKVEPEYEKWVSELRKSHYVHVVKQR